MTEKKWNAENIRTTRLDRGLTQTELSEKLGCRMHTVSEWETGMYLPGNAYQRLLNALFGKPKK